MPLKRSLGTTEALPNSGSEHHTATTMFIDIHYARLSLVRRWTWVRFVRLANFLQMTPWELASLALIRHKSLASYKHKGFLPSTGSRPAALILTLIEAKALKGWTNDILENPFPSLSRMYAEGADDSGRADCPGHAPAVGAAADHHAGAEAEDRASAGAKVA